MNPRPFLEPGQQPPAIPPRFPDKPAPGRPPRRKPSKALAPLPILPPEAAIGLPEIVQPNPNPRGHTPRIFRMVGDAMAPSVQRNDILIAVPVSAYHCEGLYLLSFAAGHLSLYRCEARQGAVHAWRDNRAIDFARLVLTRAEFEEAVMAQVAMTGRLIAGGLLPEVVGELVA
ncbi:hypothetical protein [Roseomonas sp. WA12]